VPEGRGLSLPRGIAAMLGETGNRRKKGGGGRNTLAHDVGFPSNVLALASIAGVKIIKGEKEPSPNREKKEGPFSTENETSEEDGSRVNVNKSDHGGGIIVGTRGKI